MRRCQANTCINSPALPPVHFSSVPMRLFDIHYVDATGQEIPPEKALVKKK